MGAEPKATYNAKSDAEKLSASMKKWASIGFLRGFSGIREEVLPKGKMNLPSAAFHEAATRDIETVTDEMERMRRLSYIAAVEAKLREAQAEYINAHFTKAAFGQAVDMALGLAVIAMTVGLIVRVGAFHPLTFAFLVLFALKLVFMHFTVRHMLKAASKGFRSEASEISLPWDTSERR